MAYSRDYLYRLSAAASKLCSNQSINVQNKTFRYIPPCPGRYGCGLGRFTVLYCALFLRNLVSGYECGRAFPVGVGPGSPSKDAANWLPSRFGLSVETQRRYGWLRMVFPGVRLFRTPIWCPSGGWRHTRGRQHHRGEPGSALSGGHAPDSAKAEGSSIVDEPGEG